MKTTRDARRAAATIKSVNRRSSLGRDKVYIPFVLTTHLSRTAGSGHEELHSFTSESFFLSGMELLALRLGQESFCATVREALRQ